MHAEYVIRAVEPGDEPALAALERAAPDQGSFVVQVDPRIGYLELVARYVGVRGYVAVAARSSRVVGMLFSSLAPTQLNGRVVPGAYLFSLRVQPSARRRGVATALIGRAWERARTEGVEVAWAGVMAGNRASLRTFERAGFARLPDLAIRVVPPVPGFGRPHRDAAWMARAATWADLPTLADALNRAHGAHNFWRPCTPEALTEELVAARHTLEDVRLVLSADGRIVAAGALFDVGRIARLRLVGLRALPERLNRALSVVARPLPIRPLVLRYHLLSDAAPILIRSIGQRAATPFSPTVVVVDRHDPTWPGVERLPGITGRLHVVTKSLVAIDADRPAHFG